MKTDWNLIRKMLGAAVDACEQIPPARWAIGFTHPPRSRDVLAGLVPAIHANTPRRLEKFGVTPKLRRSPTWDKIPRFFSCLAWMAGTSPARTAAASRYV